MAQYFRHVKLFRMVESRKPHRYAISGQSKTSFRIDTWEKYSDNRWQNTE